ncbi:hypothetical protein SAMN06295912_1043 [Sphingomonas laterariae]|uniref:Uncharacterized protein n=1 Tax=Edaphosphingomonas laterariae TaxID=861865 RepID=A0A239DAS2_9SPHN|nr:hypothetical protein [Sphingomonas laterariae]SNS29168.1 hypothetical protein SAMN06295912_1043 [Sphingomonas laterariae]
MTAPEDRKLPELIVTKGGVPFADQAEGVRQFKAACLAVASEAEAPAKHAQAAATIERKAIIAWHREQARLCGQAANAARDQRVQLIELEKARHHVLSAACIERGAHERMVA